MKSGEKIHFSTHSRRLLWRFSAIQSKGLSLSHKLFGLFVIPFSLISFAWNSSNFYFYPLSCKFTSRGVSSLFTPPFILDSHFSAFYSSFADESCSQARDSGRWHFKPFLHMLGCWNKSSFDAEFGDGGGRGVESQPFMSRVLNSNNASSFKFL